MALPGGGLNWFGRRSNPAAGAPTEAELWSAMPAPLLIVDTEGLVARANPAAETFLNLSEAAMRGRELDAIFGMPAGFRVLGAVPSDSPFAVYDIDLSTTAGRRQRADLMMAPFPERAGWRVVSIHSRAASHLVSRRMDREGGTLSAVGAAAMLAHEIKNPLSAIRGAAQLLESSAEPAAYDLTRLIRDEVDRVAALIDRMEGFTDTRPLELEPQNIHAILGHARDVAMQGFALGFTVRELYDPSLPAVLGHRDSLVQVVINLLKNAAEAMEGAGLQEGTITLTTAYRHGVSVLSQREGRKSLPIEVCVIDEGPGAPAEISEHLFDPFVSSKRSGRGLGLALVDKMIADQGGMVEYAREGEPAKTVFRLLLPRAKAKA
jgi:two-component system nitrogen regulation sensor histidine kinase GlnL